MKEILKGLQAVAKEYGDKYAIVTYDLAVAKIAKQIQFQSSPEFGDCLNPHNFISISINR